MVFFSFARKECEMYAGGLTSFDFNTEEEKATIEEVYNNALQCLSREDRDLPAVEKMLPMLQRGIGVHHSGLLPILKELIEILFQEQLVKVLFATETFAMGLNMPAKTVVFTDLKKFDGEETRLLESGEYIQMSGRAGRRGKDDRGLVILMLSEGIEEEKCKAMVAGKPSPLNSSFKLSYYTMLNMLRRLEGSTQNMEHVIQNSFQQFQHERAIPSIERKLKEIESKADAAGREGDEAILRFSELRRFLVDLDAQMRSIIMQPHHCLQFLKPGRIISIKDGKVNWGYAVVVNAIRNPGGGVQGKPEASFASYICDCLLACDSASVAVGAPRPASKDKNGGYIAAEMLIVPIGLQLIRSMSTLRISIPPDLRSSDNRRGVLLQLQELERRHLEAEGVRALGGPLPILDPIEDMGIEDESLFEVAKKIQEAEKELLSNPVFKAEKEASRFDSFAQRAALLEEADRLRSQLKSSQIHEFRSEAKSRKDVLRKLGHIDENEVVLLKGRAACEIDAADELVATELLFNGTLIKMDKHELVALVSCLVPAEKSEEIIKLTTKMAEPLAQLQETARFVAEVSKECKLPVVTDDYVASFRPTLMDITYSWSRGASFRDISLMTDIYEGSIIRAMRRLDELMQQLTTAAKVVGDEKLALHIEESNLTIRRDLIFAASLYI